MEAVYRILNLSEDPSEDTPEDPIEDPSVDPTKNPSEDLSEDPSEDPSHLPNFVLILRITILIGGTLDQTVNKQPDT